MPGNPWTARHAVPRLEMVDDRRFRHDVTTATDASHAVGRPAESFERLSSESIGLLTPIHASLFPAGRDGFPQAPSPALSRAGSSSPELASASEYVFTCHPPDAPASSSPPPGLVPHRGISARSPLTASFPRLASRSALSVSHTLDGFLLRAPHGLVSSHSHVRGSHFRGFPRCPAVTISRWPVPS
jgi:hypothetical protein